MRQEGEGQSSGGICVLNINLIGHMVWQEELFNILNLGSGIQIKLGGSMYNDVIMWVEASN